MSHFTDWKAIGIMLLIPLIWGIGFPLTHNAVSDVEPGVYIFGRYLIALLVITPFALKAGIRVSTKTLIASMAIGIMQMGSAFFQAKALQTISSAETAFCVCLSAAIIAVYEFCYYRRIPAGDAIAVVLSLLGVALMSGLYLNGLGIGYMYGLMAAFCISAAIIITGFLSRLLDVSRFTLVFWQLLAGTLIMSYWPVAHGVSGMFKMHVIVAVLFAGVFVSAVCLFIQVTWQRRITDTQTALIFNMDLVFASLFGLINGESISVWQASGCLMMMLAISATPVMQMLSKNKMSVQ
ncbi:DMT family transporter [Serratia ficaria]|uniref:DMT family transporter n=1 Tax=Serratia ficaria TaxID=61651 RepID=UPI002177F17E|nr:DMT family transporter [Serratia ficaria]CAI1775250.1 EamA-like transporter family [Serratia ficaria]